MPCRTSKSPAQRIVFGVLLTAVGVILLLHNSHLANVDLLFRYWPMIFVVMAVGAFIEGGILSMKAHLMLLLAAGLQLMSLERFSLMGTIWPLAIVYLGLILTLRALFPRAGKRFCQDTEKRQA